MKVSKFRQILDKFSELLASSDREAEAEALRKLSASLKPADEAQVASVVDKLQKRAP